MHTPLTPVSLLPPSQQTQSSESGNSSATSVYYAARQHIATIPLTCIMGTGSSTRSLQHDSGMSPPVYCSPTVGMVQTVISTKHTDSATSVNLSVPAEYVKVADTRLQYCLVTPSKEAPTAADLSWTDVELEGKCTRKLKDGYLLDLRFASQGSQPRIYILRVRAVQKGYFSTTTIGKAIAICGTPPLRHHGPPLVHRLLTHAALAPIQQTASLEPPTFSTTALGL